MANTALHGSRDAVAVVSAVASDRPLWQVPVFLLGVILLGLVFYFRHAGGYPVGNFLARDLSDIRHHLAKRTGNLDEIIEQAEKLLQEPEQLGTHQAEAHFLLGTAHLRRGEMNEAGPNHNDYIQARSHLEEAKKMGIRDKDQGNLNFRLAWAGYYTGIDSQQLVEAMAGSMEQADESDKARGCLLLTDLYLRLPNPDYKAALAVNERLRKEIALVPESILAPARVKGGELLVELGRYEDARRTLEHVGEAFPDVQARAKQLIARSYLKEENWNEASRYLEQSLANLPVGDPERPRLLYELGLCYRRTDRFPDGLRLWKDCADTGKQPWARAATLNQVEILLAMKKPADTADLLAKAVSDISKPETYDNSLVPLVKACEIFEETLKGCRQANSHETALKILDAYGHIVAPQRPALLRAEITQEWAALTRRDSRQISDGPTAAEKSARARDLFCRAGSAFVQAGNLATGENGQTEKADRLWDAIRCYREAPDHAQVVQIMKTFFPVNTRDERTSEGWFILGEIYRQENRPDASLKAFEECVKFAAKTRFYFLSNHQLALKLMEQDKLDEAEGILESNLTMLRNTPDAEAQEKTLFSLGEIYFRKRNYGLVVRRLQEALLKEEFRKNPMVIRAKFYLAESYYQLAIIENSNSLQEGNQSKPETLDHFHQQYRSWMEKAAQEFSDLAWMLDKPETGNLLKDPEKISVVFKAADCRFMLGKYDEALKAYENLVLRYRDRIEGLTAMGGTVRCYSALHMDDEMGKRLEEMQRALDLINDPMLHEQWVEWMKRASRRTSTTSNPR